VARYEIVIKITGGRVRIRVRSLGMNVPEKRITEVSDARLASTIRTLERALGPSLILYEMAAVVRPEREHDALNFDDASDDRWRLHHRWRALIRLRREQRRRERQELKKRTEQPCLQP
jgi:hypothetical protein